MPQPAKSIRNTVRIIGGQWRSRKLHFDNATEDLRPTPDRVRETLFNWLQEVIVGARCLDVFAGSGALGFEALSRGAAFCLFIDKHGQNIQNIQHNLQILKSDNAQVIQADSVQLLQHNPPTTPFNIVFIDPPYSMNYAVQCCHSLAAHDWLMQNAYIYIESATAIEQQQLPELWSLHRYKQAGNVHYHLAMVTKP